MIVDAHTHVWPEHLASRALGANIPGMQYFGDGTVSGLVAAQLEAGIDYSLCLGVANNPHQLGAVNSFIGSLDRDRFIPFGSIHPSVSIAENLSSLRSTGIRGVKLHPVFQGYRLDDRGLYDLLGALEGEFCVVVHVGDGPGSDGTECSPQMVREIATTFPKLELLACHLGGYHRLEEAMQHIIGLPIMIDTSWPPSLAVLEPSVVRNIIRRHGAERVVFASDWPAASPLLELRALDALELTQDELAGILGGNLAALLGLKRG